MTALTLIMNIAVETASMSDEERDAMFRQQGFVSARDAEEKIYKMLQTTALSEKLSLNAAIVTDENGRIRRTYNGMILARWEDEDGRLVLGIGNGDSVTVILPE